MKRLLIMLILSIVIILCYSNENTDITSRNNFNFNSPYPIILVHGLNSGNYTWDDLVNFLSSHYGLFLNNSNVSPASGSKHIFHTVQNMTVSTDYRHDVGCEFNNEPNDLAPGQLYTINFDNYWNYSSNGSEILYYNEGTPGCDDEHSKGNQSAITKQAYALKKCIEKVLAVNNAEKVILVGHSMGGLAIREYLQRVEDENLNGLIDGNENHRKWWIDSSDYENGHKVARVVTIGTPHLGSNTGDWIDRDRDILPNFDSEAVRDLRYEIETDNIFTNIPGIYLFGGSETSFKNNDYHNNDVNCDGNENSLIVGLNQGNSYHPQMTLPENIKYTWITSDVDGDNGDGVVALQRQYLYDSNGIVMPSTADTLLTTKVHTSETHDVRVLMRGLDEPSNKNLAYKIKRNVFYKGFFTPNTNYADTDCYKMYLENGILTLNFNIDPIYIAGKVVTIKLYSFDSNTLIGERAVSGPNNTLNFEIPITGDYFLVFSAGSLSTRIEYDYSFNINGPVNLAVQYISQSIVDLTWEDPIESNDNRELMGYNVYRNNILINSEPINTKYLRDTTIIDNTDYTYYITAVYANPNSESAHSNEVIVNNFNRIVVSSLSATNITSSSATLRANVSNYSNMNGISYGFKMSTVQGFTTPENVIPMGTLLSAGDFNRTVTTLTDNTTYYYRVYISNGTDTANGEEISFTTPVKNDIPKITNYTVNQRPDNKYYVDIKYYIEDNDDQSFNVSLQVSDDNGLTWDVPVNQAHLSGDIGPGVNASNGTEKHIIWNVGQNLPGVYSHQFKFKVTVDDMHYDAPSAQNMVFVEGGTFQMGAEGIVTPVHSVTLSSFYIGKYEVTQAEWQFVMSGNTNGISTTPSFFSNNPTFPVHKVSWYDIMVYSNRKSIQEGLTPCYAKGGDTNPDNWGIVPTRFYASWNAITMNKSANGYRLPTEAEWEYSARGGNHSNGYTYAGSNTIGDVAWCSYNSLDVGIYHPDYGIHTVGTKAPNELGTYDMSGNVGEWCWDWYSNYSSSAQTNPTGATSGLYRVCRGGTWDSNACRVVSRGAREAYYHGDYTFCLTGFRLARSIP